MERDRKAAEAYKQAEKLREQQRQKEETIRKKLREKHETDKRKVELALKKLETAHGQKLQVFQDQQMIINKKIEAEETRWNSEKKQLEKAIDELNNKI